MEQNLNIHLIHYFHLASISISPSLDYHHMIFHTLMCLHLKEVRKLSLRTRLLFWSLSIQKWITIFFSKMVVTIIYVAEIWDCTDDNPSKYKHTSLYSMMEVQQAIFDDPISAVGIIKKYLKQWEDSI